MNDNDIEYGTPEPEEKKNKFTKGFYIVLALCLCAIGVAGWYTYADVKNYMDSDVPKSVITSSEPQNKQAEAKISGVTKSTEVETEEETELATEEFVQEESEEDTSEIQTVEREKASPVGENREIIGEFSAEKFIYFETLKDWRLHKGIDYAIDEGSDVYSISQGEVKDIVKDDIYGQGIVIEFYDMFIATYYGVEPTENIAIGSILEAGDVIGKVVEIPCEKSEKSHIHLEITREGNQVNPETYLNNQNEN